MTATLSAAAAPEVRADARRFVLDCRHGTTTAIMLPSVGAPDEATIMRIVLARHYDAERCRCTRALRRRYGVAG